MTERELIETFFDALNMVNSNFEFWLTATFAFIMAIHFAGSQLSIMVKRFLQGLYLLAAVIFFSRFVAAATLLMSVVELIAEVGTEVLIQGPIPSNLIGILNLVVMITGTIGAVVYSHKTSLEPDKNRS
ncbi:MAG: hypothetical protein QGG67_14150 [Gammaproteobacteria bacterium]|jgi:hypothetical protein|nr:hypothetical protein [Gammaproteobacteria bacterium]MDP6097104.1 hypothetical protein [Gammaproteobacteria bacterium]|tara:strand:- start:572 stop:958 length:387 start_codon:yes stop_codon:yes gene_type:complete